MSDVVSLNRRSALLWSPATGEVVPVRDQRELGAQVSALSDYGEVAKIHGNSPDGREVTVTALAGDGWLVRVREAGMTKDGWPYAKVVTRLLENGTVPTLASSSQWYSPDQSTDLAGSALFAEEIQFKSGQVVQAAWAWMTEGSMPSGCAAGRTSYDAVLCDSVAEALTWISDSSEAPWPEEGGESAIELAESLDVDRVIATSPNQIVARVANAERRVQIQRKGTGTEQRLIVVGLTDELGREYSMRLPERAVIRIKGTRGRRG